MPWAMSLGFDLANTVVMCDRGGEFAELSPNVKHPVKTAAYFPQANGTVERKHKYLAAYCRLYDRKTPEVAEFLSNIQAGHVRKFSTEAAGRFL